VLVVADKLASIIDMTHFVGGLFTGHSLKMRRKLRTSDPFIARQQKEGRITRC
jgi:glycyl-tRNA synthetase beta chain/uncharacterized protein